MPRPLLTDWDKRLNKNINAIKRAVKALESMGLSIEIDKDVETMMGETVDHVYVMDRCGTSVMLQKHLFTVR